MPVQPNYQASEPLDWREPVSWDDRIFQSISIHRRIADGAVPLPPVDGWAYFPTPSGSADHTEQFEQASPESWKGAPGTILKGRFLLESIIGSGGMSVVFKARDLIRADAGDTDPHVAIKILNERFRAHPESLVVLQEEARKSQRLAHPNIVRVFEFDRDGTSVYMVMELLEGMSLRALIEQTGGAGMPFARAWPILSAVGGALSYAHHQAIVHTDVKPSNIFVTTSGVTKVFDFTIAGAIKIPSSSTQEVTLFDPKELGALTPAYASLERLRGSAPTPKDDIFGFALVAYELLTGLRPYGRLTAAQAFDANLTAPPVRQLNGRQWRALSRGLALRGDGRQESMAELLEELAPRPPWYRLWRR